MGGVFGFPFWSASYSPQNKEVSINLTKLHAYLPYSLNDDLNGKFRLNFNLGYRSIEITDLLQLARQDMPLLARIPIAVEMQRNIPLQLRISGDLVDRLSLGRGVIQPILNYDSDWRKIGRIDTDMGFVVIESRVVSSVEGVLKLLIGPTGWFGATERKLSGSAAGNVDVYVRVRFESQSDRNGTAYIVAAIAVMVAAPVALYALLQNLVGDSRERLPPPSEFGTVPSSTKSSAGPSVLPRPESM